MPETTIPVDANQRQSMAKTVLLQMLTSESIVTSAQRAATEAKQTLGFTLAGLAFQITDGFIIASNQEMSKADKPIVRE